MQHYSGPANTARFISNTAKAVGLLPRRSIIAGTPLTDDMLQAPLEVERGALVSVIVQNGAAHLEAQGVAEQSGRLGDVISVKNPKERTAVSSPDYQDRNGCCRSWRPRWIVSQGPPL